jgi:hypothetical protein
MASKQVRPGKKKHAGGRPTKRTAVDLAHANQLAREGKTLTQIANLIGISRSTLCKYKAEHKEFTDALNDGAAVADDGVQRSLYERAMGYECDEERVAVTGEVVTVRKKFPPDVVAAIFWLKNRRPKEWRDKQEIEHTGTVDLVSVLSAARNRATAPAEGGAE